MITRLAARYLVLFLCMLALLSASAYMFMGREYAALLAPALGTPEGASAYTAAMQKVGFTIAAFDVPLVVLFGVISWLLARASLQPLIDAQDRERRFAADAAHALRSPLATIAAIAQSHVEIAPDEQHTRAYQTIARAALDASAVVADLLTLARAAQPGALQREPIDAGAVVQDVVREFEMRRPANGVSIECKPQSAIIEADERRIREVTRNLIENAMRHARTRVRVSVNVTRDDAEIAVWNDGDPIPAAMKPRLFERFFRAAAVPERTGLGLAIVSWIVRAHGGSASVRDAADGAEFVVRLPLLSQLA